MGTLVRDEPRTVAEASSTSCSTRGLRRGPYSTCCRIRQGGPEDVSFGLTVCIRGRRRPGCACCPRCGSGTRGRGADEPKPCLRAEGRARFHAFTPRAGRVLAVMRRTPELLFTENESNAQRLWASESVALRQDAFPRLHRLGPGRGGEPCPRGTKAAAHYALDVPAGGSRRSACGSRPPGPPAFRRLEKIFEDRIADADEFLPADHAVVAERGRAAGAPPALAGMLLEQAVLLLRPRSGG